MKIVTTLEESRQHETLEMETLYREKVEKMRREKERLERDVEQMMTEMDVLKLLNNDLKCKHEQSQDKLIKNQDIVAELTQRKYSLVNGIRNEEETLNEMKEILTTQSTKKDSILSDISDSENKTEILKNENETVHDKLQVTRTNILEQNEKLLETTKVIQKLHREAPCPLTSKVLTTLYEGMKTDEARGEVPNKEFFDALDFLSKEKLEDFHKVCQVEENNNETEKIKNKIEKLIDESKKINDKISNLESLTEANEISFQQKMNEKCSKITEIEDRIKNVSEDIAELIDIKQGLDAEIRIYKTLLDLETESSEEPESAFEGKICIYLLCRQLQNTCHIAFKAITTNN